MSKNGFRIFLVAVAVLVTAAALGSVVFGVGIPDQGSAAAVVLVFGGLVNSVLIYLLLRPGRRAMSRDEHIAVEFRHEVERFLGEMGRPLRGIRGEDAPPPRAPARKPPEPVVDRTRLLPPEELLGRITENLEILGGYREDLAALLGLYRLLQDGDLSEEDRGKAREEIHRFEKVVALPFLLEDSGSVQHDTGRLLEDLRRQLLSGEDTAEIREDWSPVDLNDVVEQVIRSMPEDRARSAWFERRLGDLPPVLSRPNTLFEALYYVLDAFLETAGAGKAIHIQTSLRDEQVRVGFHIGSLSDGGEALRADRRLRAAAGLWAELGAEQSVGDGRALVRLPAHGPISYHSEPSRARSVEKTG
ncbi:MAG: hypothetical protein JW958_02600 [Candidatus Eisenbacteria bacterium]|nr:hypothetical protein [Candidatus Eisenbacteria bacterium]